MPNSERDRQIKKLETKAPPQRQRSTGRI